LCGVTQLYGVMSRFENQLGSQSPPLY